MKVIFNITSELIVTDFAEKQKQMLTYYFVRFTETPFFDPKSGVIFIFEHFD